MAPGDRATKRGDVLVGVEEEFLLVDAVTMRPAPRIEQIMTKSAADGELQKELHQAQIETATDPCGDLVTLRADLERRRQEVAIAAAGRGALAVPAGTYPAAMGEAGQRITGDRRYQAMAEVGSHLVREQLICGCHVHVSVPGPDEAIDVVNRVRRWLPCLTALAANSPYWEGQDTGYASYRTEVWTRWPTAGPTAEFASMAEYEQLLDRLVAAGIILDRGMAYWDVRPSQRYPTVELRVADVMPTVDDVMAVAGLARALVVHCLEEDGPVPVLRPELLRAASWRAARYGLEDLLMDPLDGSVQPAASAVQGLVALLRPTLTALGDGQEVATLVDRVLERGNGADRQRAGHQATGRLETVIGDLALEVGARGA